jgi:hypothetical protein
MFEGSFVVDAAAVCIVVLGLRDSLVTLLHRKGSAMCVLVEMGEDLHSVLLGADAPEK